MRWALLIVAIGVLTGGLWLGLRLMAPERGGPPAGEAMPAYLGGSEGEEVAPDAFGPGPSICSMDPRYRPKPGVGETCPVVP